MTDDELKSLIASNAKSCAANSSALADLGRSMLAFREEMGELRSELASWVATHNQISDDQGAILAELEVDRNLFREEMAKAAQERQALMEIIQRQLAELSRTNRRIDDLNQAG